jgi:hypothetical protein
MKAENGGNWEFKVAGGRWEGESGRRGENPCNSLASGLPDRVTTPPVAGQAGLRTDPFNHGRTSCVTESHTLVSQKRGSCTVRKNYQIGKQCAGTGFLPTFQGVGGYLTHYGS